MVYKVQRIFEGTRKVSIRILKNYYQDSSFEVLLNKIFSEQVKEKDFARKLYDCLCNTIWYNKTTGDIYSCSFRYAGDILANMRHEGESYLDFYCNGFKGEGAYHAEVYKELNKFGYKVFQYRQSDRLQKYEFTGRL